MNIHEAAKRLDGSEYGQEGSPELFAAMKASGLVAAFGASDDLVELRGAVDEELGAWQGTSVHLTPAGFVRNECQDEDCPYHARELAEAVTVEAVWDKDGFSWVIETKIPHATFIVMEGSDPFCRGVVFALKDARREATASPPHITDPATPSATGEPQAR